MWSFRINRINPNENGEVMTTRQQPNPGMTTTKDTQSNWNPESLKEHIEAMLRNLDDKINLNDRRYEERFVSQQRAVDKQETAQLSYDNTHNDIVRKMEGKVSVSEFQNEKQDSAKSREKIEMDIRILRESKSGAEAKNPAIDQMATNVQALLLKGSGAEGRHEGTDNTWKYIFGVVAVIGTLVTIAFLFMNYKK